MSEAPLIVRAKYAYVAKKPDELSIEKKDLLVVLRKEDKGWWLCRKKDGATSGLVPYNYVAAVELAAAPKAAATEPVAVEAPAAVVETPTTVAGEPEPSAWERRALAAEDQLRVLMRAAEDDVRDHDEKLRVANERANQLELQIISLQSALNDDKAERDRVDTATLSVLKHSLATAQDRAASLEKQLEAAKRSSSAAGGGGASFELDIWKASLEASEERVAALEKQLAQAQASAGGDAGSALDAMTIDIWKASLEASEERVAALEKQIAAQNSGGGGDAASDATRLVVQLQAQLAESHEETARVRAEKEALARSASSMSSAIDAELETERAQHREAAERAQELHDLYEGARKALQERETELRELKRKTARLVELASQRPDASFVEKMQKQIDTLESKLATARAEAAYAASSSSSTQPPSSPPQPHASKAAPKFEVHVPSFAPAPPPPPPPRAAVPSARRAPPSSSSSSSSGGGPTCPKCKSQFASFETFYGHEPCPGARAGLLSEISEGACLRKAPAPVSKPNVVEKKPGAFANFAEIAAKVAKERQERAAQAEPQKKPHRELESVILNIRTSQRDSGAW